VLLDSGENAEAEQARLNHEFLTWVESLIRWGYKPSA
jgi:hypothetical protein